MRFHNGDVYIGDFLKNMIHGKLLYSIKRQWVIQEC